MSIMQSTTYGFDGILADHFQVWVDDPAPSTAEQANGVLRFNTQNQLIGDGGVSEGFLSTATSPRYDQSWSTELTAMVPAGLSDTPQAYDTYLEAALIVMFTATGGATYSLSSGLHLGDTTQNDRGYISEYAITPAGGEWTEYLDGQGERGTADISGRVGIRFDAATKVLTAYNSQQVLLSIDLDATGTTDWNMVDTDTFQIGPGFTAAGWHVPQDLALTMDDFAYTLADNMVNGADGNDTLDGRGGNDLIVGGTGTDTVVCSGNLSSYSLTKTASGYTVQDKRGTDGTDTLSGIERLQFADTKLALDLDGNAGTTAKILGAVFGPSSVASQPYSKQYVGIGLSYLDGGMSYQDLMQLALNAAGATSHAAIVNLLWTNIVGSAPTAAQAAPYEALLDNGSYTPGSIGAFAADLDLNKANINLIGLYQTGIEYL